MSTPLRIVFMGTPDFALPSLRALLDGPDQVVAVVCQPDRPRGRGQRLEPQAVKKLALSRNLVVLQPESLRAPETIATLVAMAPDLLVVVAYGKILPPAWLQATPLGAMNVHGSLLPKYRGAAPIQWAIIQGERESGVTIMQLDAGMDTGPMLLSAHEPIGAEDTAGLLFERLAIRGAGLLMQAIAQLKQGSLQAIPQQEELATYAPMLKKEDGHINWAQAAAQIHCLIRGLDPWPSAYGFLDNRRYRFFCPERIPLPCSKPPLPGTVLAADKQGLVIAAGVDALRIREIQAEGKKRMSVADYLRGGRIVVGSQFT